MTSRIVLLALLGMAACGGGPTSPSAPVLPNANIVTIGNFTQGGCDSLYCSYGTFSVTNNGPGCVLTADLNGIVTIISGGQTIQADWELTLGSKTASVFQKGATLQAISGGMSRLIAGGTYTVTVQRSTKVACSA